MHCPAMFRESRPALTVRELAKFLNVNERTVYRMAQAGRLPGFRVEGTWRFLEADVAAWLERQKSSAQTRIAGYENDAGMGSAPSSEDTRAGEDSNAVR